MDDAPEKERFPRRAARRQQTRARILEVALSEFQRVGYAEATMNAIAEAANIHITTLFTHFRTKKELAETLASVELDQLANMVDQAKGRVPFFEFFRDLVLTTAKTRQAKGDHKRGISREAHKEPELALNWMRYEDREIQLLAAYIAADYGLDVAADYVPFLAAKALISSGVLAWSRWSKARASCDLVTETEAALDLAERMARAILPLRPLKG
ncbi:helix-turn-helix domain-containing protein [Bradyrhizobium sp. INPA03-11B]|uniref:TetR/AcrR family transcriptional regulator n=1 Tax=Bradyrhizobium sp. INPA03-11B TaxID=418598 RepID=UPI00338E524B